jgi:trk system potassium uptake protein TrkH
MALRVDLRSGVSLLGTVLKWFAVPLTVPLLFALWVGENPVPFAVPLGLTAAVGWAMERTQKDPDLRPRDAYFVVSLIWLLVAVVGAVPFLLVGTGVFGQPVNALFESMSGVTTTGATVMVDFDAHPRALLLWRQLLQWLGGLGILVLATAVLSQLSVGGAQLMETESQTTDVTRVTPRIVDTARRLWAVYVLVTVLAVATLLGLNVAGVAPEMTPFDAVGHALTSVSTSGFSPRAESVGAFGPAVQWAMVPFMFVGAVNFVLLYHLLRGESGRLRGSAEFRFYAGVTVLGSSLLVALLLLSPGPDVPDTLEATVRHGVFQFVSILTTTGYATVNFDLWPASARHVLFAAMFVGGMAGSTTCSIKAVRWLVVLKSFRRDLFTEVHPEAVRPVRLGSVTVSEETIEKVYGYTLVTLLLFFLATTLIAVDAARAGLAITEFEAMGAAASTFLNIGPAFGIAGPFGSYVAFPRTSRALMVLLMWVGRIEIIPVFVILTPSYWRS